MSVVTFVDYTPSPRFDGNPWTTVRLQEATTPTGTWTTIETFTLSPLDADPENPVARSFTTEDASSTLELWYRLVFVDGTGDEEQPTEPVQNVVFNAYASVAELARLLKIRAPSDEQESAMRRVLTAAAGEIRSEIDLEADTYLEGWQLALAAQVNLERAAELWKLQEVQFGIVMGSELGTTTYIARDTWKKHSITLAPLKGQFPFA